MRTFAELLRQKKEAIVQRWVDAALASYSDEGAAAFAREKDPFANPVGHGLRVATRRIFDALLDGPNAEAIREPLHEIIRTRAVQQFSASEAVGFVFQLRDAVRTELGRAGRDASLAPALAEFDGQIDRIALAAFDIFVQCREQVFELRVNEVKRRVSWVMDKMNKRDSDPELAGANLEQECLEE
ncbi:MAG: RsbRD N-terminal domain-containing protein [Lentisphaerae bacterium]|nr:RsbRD N-terminal domain-containing protein [Lentisphaerota bacterium]